MSVILILLAVYLFFALLPFILSIAMGIIAIAALYTAFVLCPWWVILVIVILCASK